MHSGNVAFLKSVLQQSVVEHGWEADSENNRRKTDSISTEELEKKIGLLPEQMRSLLFMKYIFHIGPDIAENILSIPYAKQKAQYAEALLAYSLGLSDRQRIAEACMEKSANAALEQLLTEYDTEIVFRRPYYSDKFKKALKEIKAAQKYGNHIALKRTAAAVLIAAVSFAATLTVNADFRARFFHWLVETFPEFSQFSTVSEPDAGQPDFEKLKNMEIGYLPEGFVLTDSLEIDPMIVYRYQDASGKTITLNASLPTGSPVLFDTEGIPINQVTIDDQTAYWWEKDGLCYLVWRKEGFEFNLTGKTDHGEAIKIAKNIKF